MNDTKSLGKGIVAILSFIVISVILAKIIPTIITLLFVGMIAFGLLKWAKAK